MTTTLRQAHKNGMPARALMRHQNQRVKSLMRMLADFGMFDSVEIAKRALWRAPAHHPEKIVHRSIKLCKQAAASRRGCALPAQRTWEISGERRSGDEDRHSLVWYAWDHKVGGRWTNITLAVWQAAGQMPVMSGSCALRKAWPCDNAERSIYNQETEKRCGRLCTLPAGKDDREWKCFLWTELSVRGHEAGWRCRPIPTVQA